MAGVTHSNLRRGVAALILGGTIAVAAGMVTGTQHASALAVIPNKTCTGNGPAGAAQPGDTLTCVVSAAGAMVTGDTLTVSPLTPTGAFIPANGCVGVTAAGTAPFTYSTTVTTETATACTFTLTATTFGTAGNNVIGSEMLKVPASTAVGTSVTQQAQQCGTVPTPCVSPFLPMGTSGAGSCVGGAAVPIVGGCQPANPLTTPTPTPTASSSGGGTGTTDNGTSTSGGVQAASTTKSTPFTSGPEHPLPVAAALVAVGGAVLALVAFGAPMLLRRRRGR